MPQAYKVEASRPMSPRSRELHRRSRELTRKISQGLTRSGEVFRTVLGAPARSQPLNEKTGALLVPAGPGQMRPASLDNPEMYHMQSQLAHVRTSRSLNEGPGPVPAPPPALYVPPSPPSSPKSGWRCIFLVPTLAVTICVMFVVTMNINDCPNQYPPRSCTIKWLKRFSFQPIKENPLLGPSQHTLVNMGALVSERVRNGQGWRLLSSTWLHAGVFHLLSNLLGLLFLGFRLEKEFGPIRVFLVYVASGFGGALLSTLFLHAQASVGASGALFGLLGATVAELLVNWSLYENKGAALASLMLLVVINVIFGLMPFTDNFAHIGGLISGFLAGFVMLIKPRWGWRSELEFALDYGQVEEGKKKHTFGQLFLAWTSLGFIIILYALGLAAIFGGLDFEKKCNWCHYLDCVPTKLWNCNGTIVEKPCRTTVWTNSTGNWLVVSCIDKNLTRSYLGNYDFGDVRLLCIETCR